MKFYLRYCYAMCFALISFLLAPPLSAQAQTREAYVAQSADKTTLTFYYDDQRATVPAQHGASRRRKKRETSPSLHGLEHGTWKTVSPRVWCSMPRSEISVPPPLPSGSLIVKCLRK